MASWMLLILLVNTNALSTQETKPTHVLFAATSNRRDAVARIVLGGGVTLTGAPFPAYAGEIGARITQAVTTSDLGISVRRSVVQGAQTMDQIDRRWEEFSDKFGLGSERLKQAGRPKPKVIPPLLPLDSTLANKMLETSDAVFSDVTGISDLIVQEEVDAVSALVKSSFQRSGTDLATFDKIVQTGEQFNFASYVHFKAYSNLLVSKKKSLDFPRFRRDFESKCGAKLLSLISLDDVSNPSTVSTRTDDLLARLKAVENLTRILHDKGFVAATELSAIDPDVLEDWRDDLSDLELSLALDGDLTQNAQILLQEQGFNLIPSYVKFMLEQLLQIKGQKLSIEEYYMDTDYNSNPDMFQVKEILLNIVLDNE